MRITRVLPLALALGGFLAPAAPVLAAPAYVSQGSTTYFGYPALPQVAQPLPTTVASTPATPPTPSQGTAPAGSSGSTTYFVNGVAQAAPATPAPPPTTPPTAPPTTPPTATTGSMWGPPVSQGTSSSGGSGAVTSGTALSQQFLGMINGARAQTGLGQLQDNPLLDQLALAKAQDMITYGYVYHYSPRLGWPINQELKAGFRAQSMGAENIAEAGTVQRSFIDLMSDPGHKQNILDPYFTQTGIAIVQIPYGVLVEELFSGPSY